jgi:superfamily II DNA helicase RecQ
MDCFEAFAKKANYKRHFESQKNKGCVEVEDAKLFCYPTICGRFGPKTIKKNPSFVSVVESPTVVTNATSISSLSQSAHAASILDVKSCESKVPTNLMMTLDEASEILKPFVRPDEDVKDLSLIFYPLLVCGFEGTMREYLEFSTKLKDEEPILTQWIKAGQLWLTSYASGHIANVSANVRHRLAEFEQQEVDGTTYGTRTFTLRRGIPRLVSELEATLRFFYRFPTTIFNDFKTEEIKRATLTWLIERAIIPRILFLAANEEPTDHGQLPVACRYCLSRGFTIKNQVQLIMNECGWFSSRISAFMHLLRAGVCGYLVTLSVENTQDLTSLELDLVKSVQNRRVTNLLAPYVKRLRELNARKPPIKNNTVNANGDITSGAFTFPKSTWSTIIPRIIQLAKTCFTEAFQDNSWEYFLVLPIRVADFVKLDASVETEDLSISLTDLHIRDNVSSTLSQLQAIAEFCLFGLGVGAVRHEEVVRLTARSVQWHNSYLYFWTESLKQGSLRGDKKPRLIEHRLSLSLSRIFLLIRFCFVSGGCVVSDELIPQLCGASMLTLVRDIFDFDSNPLMLNVRHFFTSVGNILLPENDINGHDGALLSSASLTEKSGHTQGTGRRAYGTFLENSDELMYDLYHKSLGEHIVEPPNIVFTPYSDYVLHAALKELLGATADFRSRQQKLMVDIAANSMTRHSYVGIPCGHGKSLSWLIPTMASYLAGRHVGLRIVILPYKFLLGHMVHQARSLFGLLIDRLRVEFLDSTDMEEQTLLPILQGDSIPSILFTNLDGASTLLRLHMTRLQKLASNNILKRVYVDEFQQLISEFRFRSAYQSFRDLGRIGSPIMCLSGSMPLSIAMSLMSYCRLVAGDQQNAIDIVSGHDPIGDGFHFDVRMALEIDSAIASHVLESTETACHIICDSKVLVEKVVKRLTNYCNVLTVTGETPSHEQMKCAEQWSTGMYDVLVSTVVALVGNENKKCRKIIVGGFLFNVSSLVQAIGRLRPDQRGKGSSVVVFRCGIHKKLREEAIHTEEDTFSELVRATCLQEATRDHYSRIFSPVGLQKVLSMKTGCYLQTMSHFYGFARSACGTCGLCLKSVKSTRDPTDLPHSTPMKRGGLVDVVESSAITKRSKGTPVNNIQFARARSIESSSGERTIKRVKSLQASTDLPCSSPIKRGVLVDVVQSAASTKHTKGNPVNNIQVAKERCIETSSGERTVKRIADCVLHELLYRCIICGRASCNGECVLGCFRCGDKYHQSAICSFDFAKLATLLPHKGVCFGCFDTQLRGMEKHCIKECPFRRRLRGMLFLDRRRTGRPFDLYLKDLYTDEMSFLSMVASFSGRTKLGR